VSAELELAERALGLVRAGDGAQATVTRERSLMLRFAHSLPTQATRIDDLTVEVSVLRDGHVARAATNREDDEALRSIGRAAEAAAEEVARTRGPGGYPGFPVPAPLHSPHSGHDPATAELDPSPGGEALRAAFGAAQAAGVEAHGAWTAAEVRTAIASSAGTRVADAVTDAFMKVVCIAPGGRSGYAADSGVRLQDLTPGAAAARAATKASCPGGAAISLAPGEYPVVMERHALALLVDTLGETAFNGLAHVEGRGALAGRLGSAVATPSLNLSDSPRFPGTLPRAFDAEGVPKAPLPLIQDGVAQAVVHDTRSAALAGAASTGHALAAGGAADGPRPTNLVLAGGAAADEAELCLPVEHGIYVTRLWYLNVVRPKETLVTAVTRDGTFLIEDGQLAAPLADMRITDSVLGILSRVQALSAQALLTSEGEFYGRRFATGVVCPAVRAGAVRFTG
jgi:PmbA protein